MKLTELEPNGTRYINPDAQADWDWLKANGKGRIAYLFGHPAVSATETVAFFLSELNHIGLRDTDAVALDLEVTDGLRPAQVAAWGVSVQSQLKTNSTGHHCSTRSSTSRKKATARDSVATHCGSPIRTTRLDNLLYLRLGRPGLSTNMP